MSRLLCSKPPPIRSRLGRVQTTSGSNLTEMLPQKPRREFLNQQLEFDLRNRDMNIGTGAYGNLRRILWLLKDSQNNLLIHLMQIKAHGTVAKSCERLVRFTMILNVVSLFLLLLIVLLVSETSRT